MKGYQWNLPGLIEAHYSLNNHLIDGGAKDVKQAAPPDGGTSKQVPDQAIPHNRTKTSLQSRKDDGSRFAGDETSKSANLINMTHVSEALAAPSSVANIHAGATHLNSEADPDSPAKEPSQSQTDDITQIVPSDSMDKMDGTSSNQSQDSSGAEELHSTAAAPHECQPQ
ncbi:uncharacterized protein PGTG_08144 [Puccinia graminis f. sp. tritici CRL 75-36-700-3]|uniref:Uncharacterized protein n=2 Tax=Puccinia graminis f. sp. tritici TaxID=56615 RepID=E3KCE7_PUCGT|nr:uncharacterized protein PGTG_08144 [Puccinia graminis f. sp. tritici CRL 75-36-700-3]EFP81895.2 hypothetical protein PGTG_08144 [Puccinia graminis f. sp. tritici CRL 75-36-700-3]